MYKRILVPLDGSPLAEQVIPYVRILGKALQSPIELIRTFDRVPEDMVDPEHGVYTDRLATAFRNQTDASLNAYKPLLQDIGVPVSSIAHEGDPASHIVNEAEKEKSTLITMSTHGRSGIGRWTLGSVTDKVLHATSNPLLIIRARPHEGVSPDTLATRSERWATAVKISTIIVTLDGSALAEQTLPHVVALAKGLESKVNLVRVTPSEGADQEAIDYLRQISERLRQDGIPSVQEQLLHGNAAGAIVDLVQHTPDDLVAMTTHGRSGVGRWVMGSVTDRVVRYSGTPVLVIRGS